MPCGISECLKNQPACPQWLRHGCLLAALMLALARPVAFAETLAPAESESTVPRKPYRQAFTGLSQREVAKLPMALAAFFDAFEREPADTYSPALASRVWSAVNRQPPSNGAVAWMTNRVEILLKREDLRPSQREALHLILLQPKIGRDLNIWRETLDSFAQKFPESASLPRLELGYVNALKKSDAAKAGAHLDQLAQSTNAAVAAAAKEEQEAWTKIGQVGPINEWRFTAVDGREVDIAKLRGKVVIVDFWATWCGPCVKELPTLTKLYATYHDKGLEIVGIAMEFPTPSKAAALEKLQAFTKERGMPWPQYSEAGGWGTIYARAYGVSGIPHMVVMDQEGHSQGKHPRGEQLVKLIEDLLGKPE